MGRPERVLTTHYTMELPAKQNGAVSEIVTNGLGIAVMMLGAGRKTKEEDIDHAAGLKLHKEIGGTVTKDELLLTTYSSNKETTSVIGLLYKNTEIGESVVKPALTHDVITG